MMKQFELHVHYLWQLVHDDVVSLEYCRTEDHVDGISTNPLVESIFIKLQTLFGLQEAATMGGCSSDIISPHKPLESCVDGGRCWNINH
jgi:hypothetical protein